MKTTSSQSGGRSTAKGTLVSDRDRKQSDIALQSMEAGTQRRSEAPTTRPSIDNDGNITRLRPDQTEYSFKVQASSSGDIDARSGRSHDSTDSKARIIRKETYWNISHEDR